jgi:hypothetical protein
MTSSQMSHLPERVPSGQAMKPTGGAELLVL